MPFEDGLEEEFDASNNSVEVNLLEYLWCFAIVGNSFVTQTDEYWIQNRFMNRHKL